MQGAGTTNQHGQENGLEDINVDEQSLADAFAAAGSGGVRG